MGRVILLILIGVALWWLLRGFFRAQVRDETPPPPAQSPLGEDMVRCARCGVNLPRSEAREEDGKLVCASNPQCR